jgi:uncharacterized protein (TIGR03546 family)
LPFSDDDTLRQAHFPIGNETLANLLHAFGTTIRGVDSSRQLALGVATGCLIGILPKDNLLFAGLLVFLIISGANLLTGIIFGAAISSVGHLTVGPIQSLGSTVLEFELVQQVIAQALSFPWVAWTRIDNTVVVGGLGAGLMFCIPAYVVSFHFFERYRERLKSAFEVQSTIPATGTAEQN